MGTVYYLPPEIVNGQPHSFTAQGDIYALSTVFRELLTGRRPVTATTLSQIVTQISKADFENLRSFQPRIPRDALAICSQGMQAIPSRRYASAALFAQDLRNFLQGRAVSARTPGLLERSWRIVRRYPVMASSLILTFLAALGMVALVVSHDYRVATLNAELKERNELLEGALRESSAARYRNEQIIYSQDIAQASSDLQRGDLRSVRSLMDRYADNQSLQGHRDADWNLIKRRVEKSYACHTKWKAPHALYAGCFKSNGRTLFVGGAGDQVSIVDPETGNVFFQYSTGQAEINCLRMNSDESLLWSAGDDGSVCAWDLRNDQLKWRTQALETSVEAHELVYLQALDRLVVRGSSDVLGLLSAQDGQLLTDVDRLNVATTSIAGLLDGRHFLVADNRGSLIRVDGTDMSAVEELRLENMSRLPGEKNPMRGIEVSPDGSWAVVFSHRHRVYLVDLNQWTIADSIEISESPRVVCFTDSEQSMGLGGSQRFWLVTRPGTCVKFEISSEGKLQELDRWTSESERIFSLVPRPYTQELYSFGGNGSLQQWSKSSFDWQLESPKIDQHWYGLLMLDCSRWLVPPLNQRNEPLFLQANRRSIDFISVNRIGVQLYERTGIASLCDVGPYGLWRIELPSLARSISWSQLIEQFQAAQPKDEPIPIELQWQERILPFRADELQDLSNNFRLVASDDGQWVAGWDQQVGCVWCMPSDSPEQVRNFAAEEVTLVWFEPTSHHCWFVSKHRELYLWNLNDDSLPQAITTMPNLPAKSLAMSPDRSRLAIMSDEKSCYLWDLKQNWMVSELIHEENLRDLTFTASGKTLITLGQKGRITCWNIASGRRTFDEAYSTRNIHGGFSRDGKYLIRSSLDNNRWHIEPLSDSEL